MQPIDFAEKWTRAAWSWWRDHDETEPNVTTLRQRATEHYGQKAHSLIELMAVASVEAMSEWQVYRTNVRVPDRPNL